MRQKSEHVVRLVETNKSLSLPPDMMLPFMDFRCSWDLELLADNLADWPADL